MNALVPMNEMEAMAKAVAESGLFGIKTQQQALSLMLIAAAEGRHPALAARDYDIIQGRPAKKTEAMLRDFLQQDGKVEWHTLDDTVADATFSHPAGGSVRISWDMARVRKAKISNQAMYDKYPRAMLRSRTVSEGIRTVCPMATSGMYNPEELQGFDRAKDITPSADVEEQLTQEEMQQVADVAVKMKLHDNIGDMVYEMENATLNAEQQIYLWMHFGSKERSAMKKEQARMKAVAYEARLKAASPATIAAPVATQAFPPVASAVKGLGLPSASDTRPSDLSGQQGAAPEPSPNPNMISPAAHKRLEARISELKLDREAVKKYVKDTFGRDHFTEMTKEEYDKLDKTIEIRAAAKERKDKLAQPATEDGGV